MGDDAMAPNMRDIRYKTGDLVSQVLRQAAREVPMTPVTVWRVETYLEGEEKFT